MSQEGKKDRLDYSRPKFQSDRGETWIEPSALHLTLANHRVSRSGDSRKLMLFLQIFLQP